MNKNKLVLCKGCSINKLHAAKGFCKNCYQRFIFKKKIICSDCGNHRRRVSQNLCETCTKKRRLIICKECHEFKPHENRDLCHRCYRRFMYNNFYKFDERKLDMGWRRYYKITDSKPKRKEYKRGLNKAQILNKYRKPCEFCGEIKVHKHHIDGDVYNNIIGNIRWLCAFHHMQEHRRMRNG